MKETKRDVIIIMLYIFAALIAIPIAAFIIYTFQYHLGVKCYAVPTLNFST